jgi:hypothetical protein
MIYNDARYAPTVQLIQETTKRQKNARAEAGDRPRPAREKADHDTFCNRHT